VTRLCSGIQERAGSVIGPLAVGHAGRVGSGMNNGGTGLDITRRDPDHDKWPYSERLWPRAGSARTVAKPHRWSGRVVGGLRNAGGPCAL